MVNICIADLRKDLRTGASAERAAHAQKYVKTAPGEYGAGDKFLGLRVPEVRRLARKYRKLTLKQATSLLRSPVHEERQLALFVLVLQFERGQEVERERIFTIYLDHTQWINNWDLVDASAHHIVGGWLQTRDRKLLTELAASNILWERRIAVIATFLFIHQHDFSDALRIAELLLADKQDLIHKAVGWMLREIGKRDLEVAERFLRKHYPKMPRTMLRYAIEKFPEPKRQAYLKGTI